MRFQSCLFTEPPGSALQQVPVWPQLTPAGFVKRTIDIAAGAVLLLLSLPWLLLTAVRLKKRSAESVFREEVFLGLHCEPFQARLFRSPQTKPLSKVLERLPLVISLLKGDVSLVGPPLNRLSEATTRQNWSQLRRFSMKPGLTGPWLVTPQTAQSQYAQDWSLKTDALILLKSLPIVLAAIRGER